MVEQITLFKWPMRTHESLNTAIFLTPILTTISLLHIQGICLGMRPAHERRLYIVTTSLVGWAHTWTDPGASIHLSVMLINTAFSHCNEECSPYFLVITHQTQARDDIDGLMQERRNSIANALEYVFLAPSHPYKECHLWVTPPPPLLFPSMQWNQYDNALFFLILTLVNVLSI